MDNDQNKLWEINVFDTIKDISDIEMQKLSWAGKHPQFVFSFTEAIGMLYDSFAFKEFIEYYKNNCKNIGLLLLLTEFYTLLDNFMPIGYKLESQKNGFQQILKNDKWIEITKKAKKITDLKSGQNFHFDGEKSDL